MLYKHDSCNLLLYDAVSSGSEVETHSCIWQHNSMTSASSPTSTGLVTCACVMHCSKQRHALAIEDDLGFELSVVCRLCVSEAV